MRDEKREARHQHLARLRSRYKMLRAAWKSRRNSQQTVLSGFAHVDIFPMKEGNDVVEEVYQYWQWK
jgi:hypothetical protein